MQYMTPDMVERVTHLLKLPAFPVNMSNGIFSAVGSEILGLYYERWPRQQRESMPFLTIIRILVGDVLDKYARLMTATKRKVFQISAPHKPDGPFTLGVSHQPDEIQGKQDFHQEIALIVGDAAADTIGLRCLDLNRALWMVQRWGSMPASTR